MTNEKFLVSRNFYYFPFFLYIFWFAVEHYKRQTSPITFGLSKQLEVEEAEEKKTAPYSRIAHTDTRPFIVYKLILLAFRVRVHSIWFVAIIFFGFCFLKTHVNLN